MSTAIISGQLREASSAGRHLRGLGTLVDPDSTLYTSRAKLSEILGASLRPVGILRYKIWARRSAGHCTRASISLKNMHTGTEVVDT
jgi:hypothetical protein